MKKFIELYTVHFVSTNGITLTNDNPRIEATEENLKKLEQQIKKNYLRVVEIEDEKELKEFKPTEEIKIPEGFLEEYEKTTNVERVKVYSKEEIEKMSKKELLEYAQELELEVKSNMKLSELKELILAQ